MKEGANGSRTGAVLLLDERDNVLVTGRPLRRGQVLEIDGDAVEALADLPIAQKIARRGIRPGDGIIKYGVRIGTATAAIAPGEHVHLHNVKSDYTPSIRPDGTTAEKRS